MSLSLIYTTFPDQNTAEDIIQKLLEERLIACANVLGPITSYYRWEGEIQKSQEIAAFLKTSRDKSQKVIEVLEKLHPYTVPAILEIPSITSTPSFSVWVQQELADNTL